MTSRQKQASYHRHHARKQCRKRMGFKLTTKLENQIVIAIKCERGILWSKRSSRTRKVYDVDLNGLIIRVVYSCKMDQIITVLPRNPKCDLRPDLK